MNIEECLYIDNDPDNNSLMKSKSEFGLSFQRRKESVRRSLSLSTPFKIIDQIQKKKNSIQALIEKRK